MKTTVLPRKVNGSAATSRSAVSKDSPSEWGSRIEHIAIGAYYRAEQRGFAPGQEIDDWLAAESEHARRDLQ